MKNRWESIEEVLIVLNDESSSKINDFLTTFKTLEKNAKVLILSKYKNERMGQKSSVIELTKKDFNLFGKPKSEQAKNIYSKQFDLLLTTDLFEGKLKKRFQKLKAKTKIGLNLKEPNDFFDINMQTTSNSIAHLINFTKEITEKIKT